MRGERERGREKKVKKIKNKGKIVEFYRYRDSLKINK